MTETQELLTSFIRTGSEPAFRELVARYLDLVYSTAVRLVEGDTHRAEDVVQVVFADLARMAGQLSANPMLGGWLHRHTCFVARTVMRGERRRQARERQAVEMHTLDDSGDDTVAMIAPILDEAINELPADDRDVILLRFFERRNLRSVGDALGITENVAQKRAARAVEALGHLLKRRGVTLSAATLASVLAAEAVSAAPTAFAVSLVGTALASAGAAGGLASTCAKLALATKLKMGIAALLLVTAGVVTTLYVQNQSRGSGQTPGGIPTVPVALAQPEPEPQPEPEAARSSASTSQPVVPPPVKAPTRYALTPPTRPGPPPSVAASLSPAPTEPSSFVPVAVPGGALSSWRRYRAKPGNDMKVRIDGTSTVHAWQVEGSVIAGFLEVGPGFPVEPGLGVSPGPLEAVAEIKIPVNSLKSVQQDGKPFSDKMDEVLRTLLKSTSYPNILFHLTELSFRESPRTQADPYQFEAKGDLSLAGVTNPITMAVGIAPLGGGKLKVSGSTPIKMTDYGITPPLVEGILATGDEVRITFDWPVADPTAQTAPAARTKVAAPIAAGR